MKPAHFVARILALFVFSLGTAAFAASFDIPAQPAAAALQLFGQQAKVEVVYPASELRKIRSTAVKGEMETAAALDLLLAGTGYSARQLSATNYAVAKATPAKSGAIEGEIREEKSGKPVMGATVRLSGSGQYAVTDKRGRFTIEAVAAGSQVLLIAAEGMQNTKVTDVDVSAGHRLSLSPIGIPVRQEGTLKLETFVVSAKKNDGVVELDPFQVTDNRARGLGGSNLDIVRTVNDVQPYIIFQQDAIRSSGAVDVADFLKANLTMNTVSESNNQIAGANSVQGNASQINLRGLGTDKTIILINGRRSAAVNVGNSTGQPDLNGIPLAQIERIEVLPTSASGIYGSGAIGGVVNVILKRGVSGGTVRVSYDNTWDTDAPIRRADISYGRSFNGGNTSVRFSAGWSDAKALLLRDRRFLVDRGQALVQANMPTLLNTAGGLFAGALPNIQPASTAATTLVLKDGRVINTRYAHIPAGTPPGLSIAALSDLLYAQGAGANLELGESTSSPTTGLLMPMSIIPTSKSAQFAIQHKLFPQLELFLDGQWFDNKSSTTYNPFGGTFITVAANAPTNPFNSAVTVRIPDYLEPVFAHRSLTRTLSAGATLRLSDWTTIADLTFSKNRLTWLDRTNADDRFFTDMGNGKLNPFVDALTYHIDYTPYMGKTLLDAFASTLGANLKASGPLAIPFLGESQLVAGVEYKVSSRGPRTTIMTSPASGTQTYNYQFERTVSSRAAYAEINLPLLKRDRWRWLNELSAQASGRYEAYSSETGTQSFNTSAAGVTTFAGPTLNGAPVESIDTYSSKNYTLGLKSQHGKSLSLRASIASAFIPPDPSQLLPNFAPNVALTTVTDRKTNTLASVQTLAGGNPDLQPQSARSFNAGAIFTPPGEWLKGLRLNVEYFMINQKNAIGTLTAQQIVDQEDFYAGRVTRNAAGAITLVDVTQLNLFRRDTEGLDLSIDYRRPTSRWGTFTARVAETRLLSLRQQTSITLPYLQYAGFPNESGAVKVKRVMTVGWEGRRVQFNWTARYWGAYYQSGAPGGPSSITSGGGGVTSVWVPSQGSNMIPSQMYHDVMFGFSRLDGEDTVHRKWASSLLHGMRFQVGVKNIFNKIPPIDTFFRLAGYYTSPYVDKRLRTYVLSVERDF